MSVLAAAVATLSSCLLLSPDREERTHVRVAITATVDASQSGTAEAQGTTPANAAAKAASCLDPAEYLRNPSALTALAQVWQLPGTRGGQSELLQETELAVGLLDAQQRLHLTGELDVPVAEAGAEYKVIVTLLVRGDRLVGDTAAGDFSGTLQLASGLSVEVDRLLMAPSALPVTDAVLTLSSPTVDDGQPGVFALQGIVLDPQTGSFAVHYDNPELSFDGGTRHLVATLSGHLEPTPIYLGSASLPVLPAGVRQDVTVDLMPNVTVPGAIGELLTVDAVIELIDGVHLSETGRFYLSRRASICPQ